MNKRIVTFICLIWFALVGFANQVNVQVESQSIVAGKPFTVTFRIDDPIQRMAPDFRELEKEFSILSTATSTRLTIINGQRQTQIVWSVVLQTNKVGKLSIPPVSFGAFSSPEMPITVEKQNKTSTKALAPDKQQSPIILQAEVDNKKPYINEAVTYTVNLYRQRGVFINGSYQQQEVVNALVVPLNKSQDSTILRDGRAFLVESMTYAIYPNDKGKLIITPPSLRGTISDIYMRRFDIDANKVVLDVQPIPKSAQKYWLPASDVKLDQEFSQDVDELKQGDTVVRTIQLTAKGLPAQLIPEFKLPKSTQAKIYEEKPERDNTAVNNQVVGTLTLKTTYLLDKSGKIDLPEINVKWFNTKTRKFETATLPRQQWQVKASQAANIGQTNSQSPAPKKTDQIKSVANKSQTKDQSVFSIWIIMFVVVGILLFGLLVILIMSYLQRKKTVSIIAKASENQLKHHLKKACQNNQASEAKIALINWASCYFDNPNLINLSQISNQIGHRGLSKAIHELNQYLYSPNVGGEWQGEGLWQAWEDYSYKRKSNYKNKNRQSLAPMFPET